MDCSPAVLAVCRAKHVDIDLVHDSIYKFLDASTQWTLGHAVANGHNYLVQRLIKRTSRGDNAAMDAMDHAAENGHLAIVQWLHENRSEGCSTATMDRASARGHLQIVQWLHVHTDAGCTTDAMDRAAASGHLRVVQWLHHHRKEGCTENALVDATHAGHTAVVQWLVRHTYLCEPQPQPQRDVSDAMAKSPWTAMEWTPPSATLWTTTVQTAITF